MITYADTAVANTLTIIPKIWELAYFRTVEAMVPQRTFCQDHFKIYQILDIINTHTRFFLPNNLKVNNSNIRVRARAQEFVYCFLILIEL